VCPLKVSVPNNIVKTKDGVEYMEHERLSFGVTVLLKFASQVHNIKFGVHTLLANEQWPLRV